MNIPALFKVLVLFIAIVGLYRLKVPLWADLLIVSIMIGLWFEAGITGTLVAAGKSAVSMECIFLSIVVVLIIGISNIMNETGVLKRLVGALTSLLGRSIRSSAVLPALIGLLPMPGGAVFSAPMVDTACGNGSQTPEQKAAINYWFRHIWEYWWPLYPGTILAATLFHTTMSNMLLIHFPLTLAAAAGGYFFILRPSFRKELKAAPSTEKIDTRSEAEKALRESACIIVIILTIFCAGPVLNLLGVDGLAAKYWPVIFGVVLGTAWLKFSERLSVIQTLQMIFKRNQVDIVLLAVTIMIFKGMLSQAGAFEQMQADLVRYNMPVIAVIVALPFIAGIVMGIAIGFVGASFPIVISMLAANIMDADARFAYLTLAYSIGYTGMMLSPVHLCLILTKDYFKADLLGIYKWLIAPACCVTLAGIALHFLYRFIY